MTRVLISAPSAVVRAGLKTILSGRPCIDVVGNSIGWGGLSDKVETLVPDVVLVELELGDGPHPKLPAFDLLTAPLAFVFLMDDPDAAWLSDAIPGGGRAVLPRGAEPEEIVAAVHSAAAGLVVLHPSNARTLFPQSVDLPRNKSSTSVETLTPREIEVLTLLAEGEGNKQIARRLGISEHTVKFHVGSILSKLGAASRTEAVTSGLRHGLIMV
ncbi:MAG: response regulator transcription factor [Chloroflexota bacterium]